MRVLGHTRLAVPPVGLRVLHKQQPPAVRMLKWHQAIQIEKEVYCKHFLTNHNVKKKQKSARQHT